MKDGGRGGGDEKEWDASMPEVEREAEEGPDGRTAIVQAHKRGRKGIAPRGTTTVKRMVMRVEKRAPSTRTGGAWARKRT